MLLGKINALTFTEQSKRYFNLKHFQEKKNPKTSRKPLGSTALKTVPNVSFTISVRAWGSNFKGE